MSETKEPMIHAAMIAVMRDVDAVRKDRSNAQQGYKFRGIDDVYNAIHGALSKHGVVTPPRVLERTVSERQTKGGAMQLHAVVKVEYDFTAADGSVKVVGPVYGEALDMSDKATNKAMSFAHKYALLETFCIPTQDVAEGDSVTIDAGASVAAPHSTKPVSAARTDMSEGERIAMEEEPPHSAKEDEITPEGAYGPIMTYGTKNKGKHASELTAHDLEWYIANERKTLDNPEKPDWAKKKAKAQLAALLDVRKAKFGPFQGTDA